MKEGLKKRLVNPYFYVGIVGVVLVTAGISPESITSWHILGQNLMDIFNNPFKLGSVCMAVFGCVYNPASKGLKDEVKTQ